jgi:AcrR family transcriptional regulator
MGAPYLRIVEAIRSQIEAGTLKAGDRVPSARRLTRDWGVALATATKALAALQAEGLVRGVVGVGTIVAPQSTVVARSQPAPGRAAERELTRDRILRTAIALADAEGLTSVTMRRLATDLGVAVMSLYRHVANKDELILLMTDRVFEEVALPDPSPGPWRAQIEELARLQWALSKRHPWIVSVMSLTRPLMIPHGMAHTDWTMRVAREAGFDVPTSLYIAVTLAGLLVGIGASHQMEADAMRETGLSNDEWMAKQGERFDWPDYATRFPQLTAIAYEPGFELSLDILYEFGLSLMLDGLERRLPSKRRR